MLIIDMPMPVKEWNCLDCKAICADIMRGHYCGITKKTIDTLNNMRARPSWCPIKGKLVRCGECEHRKPPTDYCEKLCKAYVPDDFYCKYGERKETDLNLKGENHG